MPEPLRYDELTPQERRALREEYAEAQGGNCFHCRCPLSEEPPESVTSKPLNMRLFPENFLKYPVHLQHDHGTGLTEGAVHAYCNGVMWQYHGR